ncbi:hypothetical protein, partial [Burkholderia sp. SIMBA_024]|uniref:hypothetical protein n=1 Tax=Burkholderia sp. SIMBA_024 TaxID=3085768 RepID=UPI00397E83A6
GLRDATSRLYVCSMWTVLIILLVAWAIVAVVGFAIEGLLWIAIIGIILFVGTILFGVIRNRTPKA